MVDLSITQNPEWIKMREAVWADLEADFKEGMRKKELQQLKNYFFTGIYDGENFPCLAYILWFPIKTPEALDFVLKNLVKKADVYEEAFYCFISDLSGYFFTNEEELTLWDYFAGSEFKPVVTSRVPVGKEKKIVSFEVNKEKVASAYNIGVMSWLKGYKGNDPKWIQRFSYFISMLPYLDGLEFSKIDSDGFFSIRVEYLISNVLKNICNPPYGESQALSDEGLLLRKKFIASAIEQLDSVEMPSKIKAVYNNLKTQHGV